MLYDDAGPRSRTEAARRSLLALIYDVGDIEFVRHAILLTSELVTNPTVHACGPVALRAQHELRVEVADSSELIPVAQRETFRRSETGGRGMQLVEALAARWGINRHTSGKAVWFEIETGPARGRRRSRCRARTRSSRRNRRRMENLTSRAS
jgi:hypothetical protein